MEKKVIDLNGLPKQEYQKPTLKVVPVRPRLLQGGSPNPDPEGGGQSRRFNLDEE